MKNIQESLPQRATKGAALALKARFCFVYGRLGNRSRGR